MNRALETERLSLRPFTKDDAEGWHAIWGDPDVIWWGANESLEQSRTGLVALLARQAAWAEGLGWFALVDRSSGAIEGDVILQPARFVDGIEIGWHLRRSAWGRGLATEAARAVLAYATETVRLPRVYAIVAITNERSLRIVAKLEFEVVRDMEYANLPHRLFAIDGPEG